MANMADGRAVKPGHAVGMRPMLRRTTNALHARSFEHAGIEPSLSLRLVQTGVRGYTSSWDFTVTSRRHTTVECSDPTLTPVGLGAPEYP